MTNYSLERQDLDQTLMSGGTDYAIFFITLFGIIFQWWACTCSSDQKYLLNMIFKILFINKSATPDINVYGLAVAHYVLCLMSKCFHYNGLAQHVIPHNGQGREDVP